MLVEVKPVGGEGEEEEGQGEEQCGQGPRDYRIDNASKIHSLYASVRANAVLDSLSALRPGGVRLRAYSHCTLRARLTKLANWIISDIGVYWLIIIVDDPIVNS